MPRAAGWRGSLADCAVGECRIIVRRTSKDGTEWSPYQLAVTPDWQDSPGTQFMELMAIPERGGFIGLLTVYHGMSQSIDIQFAASRDGKTWWQARPPGMCSAQTIG